jgi:hypothetical protein
VPAPNDLHKIAVFSDVPMSVTAVIVSAVRLRANIIVPPLTD